MTIYFMDSSALIKRYVTEIDTSLILSAGELLFKQPLRALDSIQLAAALKLLPAFGRALATTYTFVAADERLLQAADAEGLSTENPNIRVQGYGVSPGE